MLIGDNFIFCHVPKTGGSSINEILLNTPNVKDHKDIHEAIFFGWKEKTQEYETKFKFAFVRNPFDWEVSNYFWHTKLNVDENSAFDITFENWVKWRYLEHFNDEIFDPYLGKKINSKEHILTETEWYLKGFGKNPQVGMLVYPDGRFLVDFIGRYETLQEDWNYIANRLNLQKELPHIEKTTRNSDYRTYYTDELVDIVTDAHKIDLDVFNYSFEDGMISKEINKDVPIEIHIHSQYNYYYG